MERSLIRVARRRLVGWWLLVSMLGTLLAPSLGFAATGSISTVTLCTAAGLTTITVPTSPGAPEDAGPYGCGPWCTSCAGSDRDPAPLTPAWYPPPAANATVGCITRPPVALAHAIESPPPPARAPP